MPEIIAAFVPYDINPVTRVIIYPRKDRKGVRGTAGYDEMTDSLRIQLFPTVCANSAHFANRSFPGTLSFRLWAVLLETALHEIGHLATREHYWDLPRAQVVYGEAYHYVEGLADDWCHEAMARIMRSDPRLGQPSGALTGYPGVFAYKWLNALGAGWDFHYERIDEWRGVRCGGQVALQDIGYKVCPELFSSQKPMHAKLYRAIHQAAKELGIHRFFVNKNGRRYRMFNAGEAELVYEWLCDNKGDFIASARSRGYGFCTDESATVSYLGGKPKESELVDRGCEICEVELVDVSKPGRRLIIWEFGDDNWEPREVEELDVSPRQPRLPGFEAEADSLDTSGTNVPAEMRRSPRKAR